MVLGFVAGALFGGKKRQKTKSETTVVNENIFNFLNRDENVVSAKVVSVQDMSVSGVTAYCKFDITQKINADLKILQKFDGKQTSDLVTEIGNEIEQQIKKSTKEKKGFLSLPENKKSSDETIVNIKNKIEKNITMETINKLAGEVISEQTLVTENLIIDPVGMGIYANLGIPPPVEIATLAANTECSIDQDIQIKYVAEQLTNKVVEIINKDASALKLANKLDLAEETESQGVGGAVGEAAEGVGSGIGGAAEGIGSGIGSIMGGAAMPAAISSGCLCMVLIAGGLFMMSDAGKNAMSKIPGPK
tara:strand:+ start:290 stop:1204 length:915 start_codon:yes stop_codon:yes gene_type:complete